MGSGLVLILILIAIGFVLILLEFLVFPGINVVGLIGFGFVGYSIYLAYKYWGVPGGHYVVLGVAAGGFVVTWLALRSRTWKKLSLNAKIDSTVECVDESILVGDIGVTVGRLAPMGKVKVGDVITEGQSLTGYIDNNIEVEVVKVYKDKIIVKPKITQNG